MCDKYYKSNKEFKTQNSSNIILCKIDIEENSKCTRCCKDCNENEEQCEHVCIFKKRNLKCNNQIICSARWIP